ncbi:hypothetical protein [Streptomyces sp. GbtcB7]|uniref:hypothetical protein n=1 Tax=Streptomyces sp. GbtcB7 TaxID=2824752 RepID=UPI0027E5BA60|nr:hypothetical protein [Streptomyces sp. GbtcB7]
MGDWARTWSVEEVLGVEPGLLYDDRLARALDAIAPETEPEPEPEPEPERIEGTVGARAIAEFGIDVGRSHWDAGPGRARGVRRRRHPRARPVFGGGPGSLAHRAEMAAHPVEPPGRRRHRAWCGRRASRTAS